MFSLSKGGQRGIIMATEHAGQIPLWALLWYNVRICEHRLLSKATRALAPLCKLRMAIVMPFYIVEQQYVPHTPLHILYNDLLYQVLSHSMTCQHLSPDKHICWVVQK